MATMYLVNKRRLRRLLNDLLIANQDYDKIIFSKRFSFAEEARYGSKVTKAEKALNKYLKELQSLTSYLHCMR